MCYDFLIVYEIKPRELESVCLLQYELEKRGYSVALANVWYYTLHCPRPIEAKVLITFALYGNSQIQHMRFFAKHIDFIINMQWEQIYTVADRLSNSGLRTVSENAMNALHIAWGQKTVDWMTGNCHINKKNVALTGSIAMDFLKPRFNGYYQSREELLSRYGIDPSAKVCLFISSFSYVSIPERQINDNLFSELANDPKQFQRISVESQRVILEWLETALKKNSDFIMIYRPHPAEDDNSCLNELAEKYPNFRIIKDYPVKQWIVAVDKIYTWYSTSAAEIYFAGKSCDILRPLPIPRSMELELFETCHFLTSYVEFENSLSDDGNTFPVPADTMNSFYDNMSGYSYMKICDCCEKVLNSGEYDFDFNYGVPTNPTLRSIIIYWLWNFFAWLFDSRAFGWMKKLLSDKYKVKADDLIYKRHMMLKNCASPQEISQVRRKIEETIASNPNA